MYKDKFVSVIIAAAGQGKRMNSKVNKQYLKLCNKPVLAHTIDIFEKCSWVDEIIVVTHSNEIEYCKENVIKVYGFKKVIRVIAGGSTRQESVFNGLKSVDKRCSIVMIHDGARPFIREEYILNSIDEAVKYKAVGIGVYVKDTIKVVDEDGYIVNTPDRKFLWAIQTPQTFDYDLLMKAYEKAIKEGFLGTDDTSLVERINQKVKMIMGSYDNIKITTPEDLYIGEAILKSREN
ncbi:2-C-methyl-D-erythritol 4-phosphate cytidylyltransferase [Crassaminicella thermophila]|uniref:2-C-methyl-D-erythritol 4-phosphate cytidylyltransferase n=1 Tax=Crassaminicella thermophila TaxID=2599308 RepID=A0A5C0SAS3_CRATE|nr:2-C-methyl-D-erythritol 4-phosphate cytidylyltransferase [Crassaminicella thermophila]QEK11140.1 2-C-methyl-D-erythritol 4-phosphate cytidylyltransferase [Crassaminicella thermophila]